MAETTKQVETGRPKPKTAAGKPATVTKSTAKTAPQVETTTSAPEAKSPFGFFSALGGRKNSAGTAGQPQKPGNPSMSRFLFGMSLYMILALAAQFALTFIFEHLPASYSTQPLFTLPLLGGVTTYLLVWMITLILILYGLYKFKILPRSLSQPRPQAATTTTTSSKVKAAPAAKAASTPVEGPNDDAYARVKARIRAERRKARRS